MRLVSVIIPTNRLDQWLDAAVASVLASRDVDLELVVVLDGVTFGSLPAWTADSRVRVLEIEENVGQTVAMNLGVRASHGSYVARLDSDDLAEPDRLTMQADYLAAHPDTLAVGGAVVRIDEHGSVTGVVSLPSNTDVRRDLLLSNVVAHSTFTFRREIFDRLGGYDETLRQMEDYEFILRIGTLGKIANLAEPMVRYRVHSTQTSRGAQPTGAHIAAVSRRRMELGRSIRAPWLSTGVKLAAWRGLQFLRYYGIVRPGHER